MVGEVWRLSDAAFSLATLASAPQPVGLVLSTLPLSASTQPNLLLLLSFSLPLYARSRALVSLVVCYKCAAGTPTCPPPFSSPSPSLREHSPVPRPRFPLGFLPGGTKRGPASAVRPYSSTHTAAPYCTHSFRLATHTRARGHLCHLLCTGGCWLVWPNLWLVCMVGVAPTPSPCASSSRPGLQHT